MSLTQLQKAQIVRLTLIEGLSNRSIAKVVGCDEHTVRRYRGTNMSQIDIRVTRGCDTQQYNMKRSRDE